MLIWSLMEPKRCCNRLCRMHFQLRYKISRSSYRQEVTGKKFCWRASTGWSPNQTIWFWRIALVCVSRCCCRFLNSPLSPRCAWSLGTLWTCCWTGPWQLKSRTFASAWLISFKATHPFHKKHLVPSPWCRFRKASYSSWPKLLMERVMPVVEKSSWSFSSLLASFIANQSRSLSHSSWSLGFCPWRLHYLHPSCKNFHTSSCRLVKVHRSWKFCSLGERYSLYSKHYLSVWGDTFRTSFCEWFSAIWHFWSQILLKAWQTTATWWVSGLLSWPAWLKRSGKRGSLVVRSSRICSLRC